MRRIATPPESPWRLRGRRVVGMLAVALLVSSASVTAAGEREGPDPSAPLAQVGNEVLTIGDFLAANSAVREFISFGKVSRDELNQAIGEFVFTRLLALEARAGGLDDVPDVRARIDALLSTAYLQTRLPHSVVDATQEEIRAFYDTHKDEFQMGRRARLAHILVPTREDARAVHRNVSQGMDFGQAARDSHDPATAAFGGDLGWVAVDRLPESLGEAVRDLKADEVSMPVETEFGYHVLKVLEWGTIAYRPLSQMQDLIAQRVVKDKQQALVDSIRGEVWDKYQPQIQLAAIEGFAGDPDTTTDASPTTKAASSAQGATLPGPRLRVLTNAVYPPAVESADVAIRLMVANLGDAPVEIIKVHSTCACIEVSVEPRTIAPGASGTLNVTLRAEGFTKKGAARHRVAIQSNDSQERLKMIEVFTEFAPVEKLADRAAQR